MKKLSNTEAQLKTSIAYKKKRFKKSRQDFCMGFAKIVIDLKNS